jgi:hypothetical protein
MEVHTPTGRETIVICTGVVVVTCEGYVTTSTVRVTVVNRTYVIVVT